MTSAEQTLHDFVLDLLSNDTARSAFGTDPSAALAGAGLHDVTPQDVQEVIPLVLDYAPAGLALPDTGAADSVIQQLQAVCHAADLHGIPDLELPEFSAPSPGTIGGSIGGDSPLGYYGATFEASSFGVSTAAGLTGGTVGAEGGAVADLNGVDVGGTTVSPLGEFDLESTGIPAALPGLPVLPAVPGLPRFDSIADPTAALDTDVSAGTVASYVSAGGDVLAGHVSTSSATLGSYLTGTGVPPVGEAVSDAGYAGAVQIDNVTDTVAGHAGAIPVPDTGALPELPHVPELPAVPALPGVPDLDLHDLPVHLPHLPVDLPHLPVELPHLPVANPLPDLSDSSVTGALGDVASHSPLGEVASPDHLALPNLVDAPTDLLLGH